MKTATLNDISFDKDDSLLFAYSDDLQLKAKAIQNSILPKLQVLLQESVSLIRKIYEIEIYDEDSTLTKYPSFRENRENELKANYENAFVGICGNRLPIYNAMLRYAKGAFGRFKELISRLQDYVLSLPVKKNTENESIIDSTAIMESANKKIDSIGIRASIRWQVFEQDNFRCVACGATALDGAILHVDHILSRSKGGADSIENYQTLCQTCNIGKSNKSERNLRERG